MIEPIRGNNRSEEVTDKCLVFSQQLADLVNGFWRYETDQLVLKFIITELRRNAHELEDQLYSDSFNDQLYSSIIAVMKRHPDLYHFGADLLRDHANELTMMADNGKKYTDGL
jgi:hypothetical protein